MLKKRFLMFAMILPATAFCAAFSLAAMVHAATGTHLMPGKPLPPIQLPLPDDPAQRAYLGVPENGFFKIAQIQAEFVILEIMSVFCPKRKKNAPKINQLHQVISKDPELEAGIRLIAVAMGNSRAQASAYARQYQVAFPVLPVAEAEIADKLGGVQTPTLLIVGPESEVVYLHEGAVDDIDALLEVVWALYGGN